MRENFLHRPHGQSPLLRIAPFLLAAFFPLTGAAQTGTSWPNWGQNLANTRFQASEQTITNKNASQLTTKWVFPTTGDVSATASVVNGAVYFPDWGGFLYKVDAQTGLPIWSNPISNYTGMAGDVSRTTPAVDGNTLYIGTQSGAYLLAIDASNGNLIWKTQVDSHRAALLTQSPTVYNGKVLIGVASQEETLAANPTYPCCTFRGSMAAVDASTGRILWKTYLVPDNGGQLGGYSGAGVWGSSASVDPVRNAVYIGTGNNYNVPQSAKDCQSKLQPGQPDNCLPPDDHIDSILSLNLDTGQINWATRLLQYDAWTVACLGAAPVPNCPNPPGPDYDFAQAPMLFSTQINGTMTDLVGDGQKSGMFWALNRDSGQVVWGTVAGPGGTAGGMEWGSAMDGTSIYYQDTNFNHAAYTLRGGGSTTGGLWGALDPATGHIRWQTADPSGQIDPGPVSTANGVVYVGSFSGDMYALDGQTGQILWDFLTTGSVNSGPAIVNGVLYWGTGFAHLAGKPGNQFYAFSLP
jgi:polyvinyl alcohol dehydrogenase (cytochrome)